MNCKYVSQKTFEDISTNQTRLIDILNHRMTGIENNTVRLRDDVKWIKIIGGYMAGIISALTISITIKFALGG